MHQQILLWFWFKINIVLFCNKNRITTETLKENTGLLDRERRISLSFHGMKNPLSWQCCANEKWCSSRAVQQIVLQGLFSILQHQGVWSSCYGTEESRHHTSLNCTRSWRHSWIFFSCLSKATSPCFQQLPCTFCLLTGQFLIIVQWLLLGRSLLQLFAWFSCWEAISVCTTLAEC